MTENKLKVVVIDDDDERKQNICEILPDYLDIVPVTYGNKAKDAIHLSCNLIIMNADDRRGQALYMFDWLKKDEEGQNLDRIPVLLLTEDEFSDRVMSFLEIGDAEIYEGKIIPDEFFLLVTSILNEAEFMPEFEETEVHYIEKSFDRIHGLSIKPAGEDETSVKRSAVFNNSEQLEHLDAALERGRKKQQLLKEIMSSAIELKEEKALKNTKPKESLHKLDAVKVSEILEEEPVKFESPKKPETPVLNASYPVEKTIAVVDADINTLNFCEVYLKRRYNVVLLNSGMNAIDFFVKNKADLLLISYEMPLLDGVKILDSIRWQPNGARVPAIFMTEGNLELIKPRCRKEYVIGMLQKPLSVLTLKQVIDAVFAGRSGRK